MILLTDEEIAAIRDSGDVWGERDTLMMASAKAQLKKVHGYGNEPCPHIVHSGVYAVLDKRSCSECWQSLLDEVKDA